MYRRHGLVEGLPGVGGMIFLVRLRLAQRGHFGGKSFNRRLGICLERSFALYIAIDLRDPRFDVGAFGLNSLLFLLQAVAGQNQALQGGGSSRFGFAQRGKPLRSLGFACCRNCNLARQFGDGFFDFLHPLGGSVPFLGRLFPLMMEIDRLGLADVIAEIAVAGRLAGLLS